MPDRANTITDEPISFAEACVLLGMRPEQVARLLGGPAHPDAIHEMTLRHALAVKVTDALLDLVDHDIAVRAGVSAGRDAQSKTDRLLVIACDAKGATGACWRRPDADWHVLKPCLLIPADLWFRALKIGLDEHRSAAAVPN